MTNPRHVYEVRPRKNHRGFDLVSEVLPFGRLWYGEPNAVGNAVDYAKSLADLAGHRRGGIQIDCRSSKERAGEQGQKGSLSRWTVIG
jgi:hypothetical protein